MVSPAPLNLWHITPLAPLLSESELEASESELEPRVRAALKQACPDLTSQQDLRDVSLSLAS